MIRVQLKHCWHRGWMSNYILFYVINYPCLKLNVTGFSLSLLVKEAPAVFLCLLLYEWKTSNVEYDFFSISNWISQCIALFIDHAICQLTSKSHFQQHIQCCSISISGMPWHLKKDYGTILIMEMFSYLNGISAINQMGRIFSRMFILNAFDDQWQSGKFCLKVIGPENGFNANDLWM